MKVETGDLQCCYVDESTILINLMLKGQKKQKLLRGKLMKRKEDGEEIERKMENDNYILKLN